ncbi:MAG: hypothetical protein AB7N76_29510 [Planctomycetota bacterium]
MTRLLRPTLLGPALALAVLALAGCPDPSQQPQTATPTPSASAATPPPSPTANPAGSPGATPGPGRRRLYPSQIAPPPGQQWPSPILPLPEELGGVPQADRRYVEVAYAVMLEAIDARLRVIHAMKRTEAGQPLQDAGRTVGLDVKLKRYREHTGALLRRLDQLEVPGPLGKFHKALQEGISQQLVWIDAAVEKKIALAQLPELQAGKRSKYQLGRAWLLFRKAYPDLDAATAKSCESHLKALQPF